VVKARRPWKGGNNRLWQLHHQDIVDKHRALLVVIGHYSGIIIGGNDWEAYPEKHPGKVWKIPEIHLGDVHDGRPMDAVHDGYVAHLESLDAVHDGPISLLPRVHLELAFGAGSKLSGLPVGDLLDGFIAEAEATVAHVRSTGAVDLN
jgi:hypothetical protein